MEAAGQRAAVCQVDGGRWLTLEGPCRLVTDPDGVRAGVEGYAARYREPEANATTGSSSRSPSTASSAEADAAYTRSDLGVAQLASRFQGRSASQRWAAGCGSIGVSSLDRSRFGSRCSLAARAPVQRAGVFTHPTTLDRLAAAMATLAVSAVHGEAALDPRRPSRAATIVRFDRNIVAAVLTSRIASCSVSVPIWANGLSSVAQSTSAAIDVADTAHHPLVEQHLAEPGLRIGVREHAG